MPNSNRGRSRIWKQAALAAAVAGFAVPALAQTTSVEELTVIGRYGVGDNVRSLSAAVPFDDLDLTTAAGRDVLQHRIRATARDLCSQLGEANTAGSPLVPSCEQDAINNSRNAVRIAYETARPRYVVLVPTDHPYVAPVGPTADRATDEVAAAAPSASNYGAEASYTTQTVTNGPVPDTPANRSAYGGPISNGGRATTPAGN